LDAAARFFPLKFRKQEKATRMLIDQLGEFHHIGLACRRLADEYDGLAAMGYSQEGDPITDPIQMVKVQFFVGGGPRVELVEPQSDKSPAMGWLNRGAKLYHFAYKVGDLDAAMHFLENRGFAAVSEPAPAVAFAMRRIVFMMSPSMVLVELVEA
jgi:methylmalonyl-CoA/ethylmalonyl-CoA epimerase